MREIKFRAWHKKLEYWVESFSLSKNGLALLIFRSMGGSDHENTSDFELSQYTGLKDINGKEIYEGDICAIDSINQPKPWTVIWKEGDAGFALANEELQAMLSISDEPYKKVIGNIYENPELLK